MKLFLIIFIKLFLNPCCLSQDYYVDNQVKPTCYLMKSCVNLYNEFDFELICENFNSLSDMNFKSNCYLSNYTTFIFTPKNAIIMDNNFKLNEFIQFLVNNSITLQNLAFNYISGFEMNFNSNRTLDTDISFRFSNLDFYINRTLITDCYPDILDYGRASLFISNSLAFFDNNKFKNKICEFVFKNARINSLSFSYLSDTYLYRNYLKFYDTNITKRSDLNCIITSLTLTGLGKVKITHDLLNINVFRFLTRLSLHGEIQLIEEQLFKYFEYLQVIDIFIDNYKQFVHNNGIKWMNYINYRLKNIDLQNKNY